MWLEQHALLPAVRGRTQPGGTWPSAVEMLLLSPGNPCGKKVNGGVVMNERLRKE